MCGVLVAVVVGRALAGRFSCFRGQNLPRVFDLARVRGLSTRRRWAGNQTTVLAALYKWRNGWNGQGYM